MNGNKELNGQTEMYDEYGNDISMGEDSSIIQYQECNLENVSVMLNELLEKNVNEESGLVGLCSDDITKLDIIRNGVKERFGVSITSEDIVNSSNVKEFADRIILIADSPDYSVRKRDLRREQLLSIAENGNLDAITKNLVKANKKLEESRDVIKNIKAPIDKIGHQYESEFWRGIFDAVDPKVGRTELKKVVLAIDGNTYHSVKALGDAIENTNTWIDEICKMLIWIIQIEDDIYGLTEEASRETLRISKLLSQEGVNIEGLTKIAALEQSKRQSFQLKIKEFKSDIHGKIEFLNEVHKNLLVQFKDHKSAIDLNSAAL